jgi:adenylate cyclase
LDKVTAQAPDLILLDVMMPITDGFTVCHILKGNDETRMIPIVIMTALDGFDDRIKGIEAGADDFLTKPVNQHELRARIQTTLKLKHTIDRKIHELRRVKDHFAKYVPEAVKRLITANPEAPALAKREQDVSVLFLDISGYSRLSAQLPPDMLNRLIEHYFSTFLDRIHEAGGDINETAGDGFMAIFGDFHREAKQIFQPARPSNRNALFLVIAASYLHPSECNSYRFFISEPYRVRLSKPGGGAFIMDWNRCRSHG